MLGSPLSYLTRSGRNVDTALAATACGSWADVATHTWAVQRYISLANPMRARLLGFVLLAQRPTADPTSLKSSGNCQVPFALQLTGGRQMKQSRSDRTKGQDGVHLACCDRCCRHPERQGCRLVLYEYRAARAADRASSFLAQIRAAAAPSTFLLNAVGLWER